MDVRTTRNVTLCPKCGGYMVRKGNKLVCANEECRHVEAATTEEN